MSKFRCPKCNADDTIVINSRGDGRGGVKRRRECRYCGERFNTWEAVHRVINTSSLVFKNSLIQIGSAIDTLKMAECGMKKVDGSDDRKK